MSLADDKRDVFNIIGAYSSFNEFNKAPRRGELYPSINNKKDVVPYLLDVLKTVTGSEALKELIGGMFTELIDKAETSIKTTLVKQFTQFNSDDLLPTDFINNGIDINVKDIDITGKLKINPNSDSGNMLFDSIKPNFDSTAFDSILNAGTTKSFGGMDILYDDITDKFNIRPTNSIGNIGEFFTNYINDAEIINKDELLTTIMDKIYGTLSKENNKTSEQILQELQADKLLEQVLNDDISFVILPSDYDDLLKLSVQLSNGVVSYDMGCGLMSNSLNFDSLTNLINTLSGSTDPFLYGNMIENTIVQSSTGNTNTEVITEENIATIKDGFFQKLIKFFTVKFLYYLAAAPQIRALLAIKSSFENNGDVLIGDYKDDFKKFSKYIICMAKEVMRQIGEYIYKLVVSKLIELLKPIIKGLLKEKINQFSNIIKSLTPLSKILEAV